MADIRRIAGWVFKLGIIRHLTDVDVMVNTSSAAGGVITDVAYSYIKGKYSFTTVISIIQFSVLMNIFFNLDKQASFLRLKIYIAYIYQYFLKVIFFHPCFTMMVSCVHTSMLLLLVRRQKQKDSLVKKLILFWNITFHT